jgi:hypothetical protein
VGRVVGRGRLSTHDDFVLRESGLEGIGEVNRQCSVSGAASGGPDRYPCFRAISNQEPRYVDQPRHLVT